MPFDDRPWEMFEKMGPMGRAPSHGYLFLASKPLADTASIPIALFGARLKRDALPDDPLAEHIGAERLDEYTAFHQSAISETGLRANRSVLGKRPLGFSTDRTSLLAPSRRSRLQYLAY